MIKHRLQHILRNGILLGLVFVLSAEPALVAARTLPKDPQAQAMDQVLAGGDRYLDSASSAVVESAELLGYVNVLQNTPIDQVSETYITDVIARALSVAEQSSIALGAVDDVADGIEQLGGAFPASMDIAAAAGVPDEMRADLIAQGIPSAQVDQISDSTLALYSGRQAAASGLPADVQADLISFGFTQAEIDQIAVAVGQRGLVDASLNTRIAQFRATQDELADTRSGMLILAVQLLGYQIATRQSSGAQVRAVTDEELQALAEDELRLLVHTAHLNAMWGNDPSAEIGEGDWWFIEHYAGRMAERLQKIIVETQNRGLVVELFLAYQMQMLAVSARTGDAEYAKAEMDSLAALLAHRLNATAYYEQRSSPGLAEYALARVATAPAVREKVAWPISDSAIKNAKIVSQAQMEAARVQNIALLLGDFDESNETNNQGSLLIVAGLEFFDQISLDIAQAGLKILSAATPENIMKWIAAILTGDTDNPALIAGNVILSLIPVIGVLPDLASLAVDPSIWIKALSLVGIIGSIGDLLALIPGLQGVGGASFLGDAAAAVIKALFKQSDIAFKAVLNALKLDDAFKIAIDLIRTAIKPLGDALGHSLDAVITAIRNVFTGSLRLWDNFKAFVRRVGTNLLLKMGFDEGSLLVGGIIHRGIALTDNAIFFADDIADDLLERGIKLSNEAADGLGRATKLMSSDDLKKFIAKTGGQAQIEKNLIFIKGLDSTAATSAKTLAGNIGGENLAILVTRYVDTPEDLTEFIFKHLGDPAVSKAAVEIAMKQSPEAVRALAGWGEASADLLQNDTFAKELAQRAGKDAASLNIISTWTPSSTPGLEAIGRNSRDGIGGVWGLGPGGDYDSGFAQFARQNKAQFYFTHPEVSAKIQLLFPGDAGKELRDVAYWKINQSALLDGADSPISKKMNFLFHISGDNPLDREAAIAIWNGASDAEIKRVLGLTADKSMPFRIRELQLLFSKGYDFNRTLAPDKIVFYFIGN